MEFEIAPGEAVLKWIVKDFINMKDSMRSTAQNATLTFMNLNWCVLFSAAISSNLICRHLYLFPYGFQNDSKDISIFVAVAPDTPQNVYSDLIFRIMIINQLNKKKNKVQGTLRRCFESRRFNLFCVVLQTVFIILYYLLLSVSSLSRSDDPVSAENFGRYKNAFNQDCGFRFFTHRKPHEVRDKSMGYLIAPDYTDLEINVVLKVMKMTLNATS
jgi:hypothetical protein